MPDSTTVKAPAQFNDGVVLKDSSVDISQVRKGLADFLNIAGHIHQVLFGTPLVVTSGNDGNHVEHSAHYLWLAVDIRSDDLSREQQLIFFCCVMPLQEKCGVVIMDERYTTSPHWHVQTAESVGG